MLNMLVNLKEINSYHEGLFFGGGGFMGNDEALKRTENIGMGGGKAPLRVEPRVQCL